MATNLPNSPRRSHIEEHEERISCIENCLLDLCIALRGVLVSLDFAKLKSQILIETRKTGGLQGGGEKPAGKVRSRQQGGDRPALLQQESDTAVTNTPPCEGIVS